MNTGLGVGDPSNEPCEPEDDRDPNVADDGARIVPSTPGKPALTGDVDECTNATGCLDFAGRSGWNTGEGSGAGPGVIVRLCVSRNGGVMVNDRGASFAGESDLFKVGHGAIC